MQITKIKPFVVPAYVSDSEWAHGKGFVLVKVETTEGLFGWGEAYAPNDCELAIAALITSLARYVEGTDPLKIAEFRENAFLCFANLQKGLHFSCAVAGIETALWDISGKALAQPVHQLLGRAHRETIPTYANCHTNKGFSFTDVIHYANKQHERGFNQIKVYPFLNHARVDEGLARLGQLRDALPPACAILVDAWRAFDYESAQRVVRALEPMGIEWLEDPVPTEDTESLARLNTSTSINIVTGETLSDEAEFLALLNCRAANTLNPDITCVGVTAITAISERAESLTCKVAIHNFNSMGPALAAALHAGAVINDLASVEYFPRFEAGTRAFCSLHWQQAEDQSFILSDEPGLGVTVDEAALLDFDYQPATKRPWPVTSD